MSKYKQLFFLLYHIFEIRYVNLNCIYETSINDIMLEVTSCYSWSVSFCALHAISIEKLHVTSKTYTTINVPYTNIKIK